MVTDRDEVKSHTIEKKIRTIKQRVKKIKGKGGSTVMLTMSEIELLLEENEEIQ